jgi:hypothetical protein
MTVCKGPEGRPHHQPVHENVLAVSCTTGILTSTWTTQSMGFSLGDTYKFADLNLGWDKRNDNSNDEFY